MRLLYRALTIIIYPFLLIFIFLRRFTDKEHLLRYKEKIFTSSFNVNRNKNLKLVWFHAASIGEFKSILPILKELDGKKNNLEFLITTLTLSSAYLANEELKKFDNARHRFLPLDINFLMKRFINLWQPSVIILVDSEIWPNLIFNANEKKIPLAIINARITKKSFKRWMIIPKFAKSIFCLFDLCLVSNKQTKQYLEKLNAKNIFSFGNIKFCEDINQNKLININENFLRSNKFWLAASTHKGEDKFCLDTHIELKKKIGKIKTIIAPRHIFRSKEIKKMAEKLNLNCQILDKNDHISKDKEIIIINSFGLLLNYYKYSKSVFIGKSTLRKFEDIGGQNPIEAAKLGCKIYHGKYVNNFLEIYHLLAQKKVSKQINSSYELTEDLIKDLNDPLEKNYEIVDLINNHGKIILSESMNKINTFINEKN